MLYINRIKKLIDDNKLTIKGFADKIGLSEPGLHSMFRQNDMKISTLQKIADYFDVPITYFLDDTDTKRQTVDLVFDALKDIVKEKINDK
ncbi:MAG: helix-turn-helix domain-containing protein [Bacteroidales bacterium]|jgi:transcriptional regulator with XRE-family HTH domain|nr:helix-turn-helix domain-containing protein [Bacteroidales bacterium]